MAHAQHYSMLVTEDIHLHLVFNAAVGLSCTNMKNYFSKLSQNTYYLKNCPLSFGLMTMLPCHICFPILLNPAYLDPPEKLDLVYESRIVPPNGRDTLIKLRSCFFQLCITFMFLLAERGPTEISRPPNNK